MALVADVIQSARFDLRDENRTQYPDEMLVDYLNRGIRALTSTLGMFQSDWVFETATLPLAIGANFVALPADFATDISAFIVTQELTKRPIEQILETRREGSTDGEPTNYAIQGLNMLFEKAANVAYTITLEYNKKLNTLDLIDAMPFNDEFNDTLRQYVVLSGKNRNEYSLAGSAAIQDFFYQSVFNKLVARNYIPNNNRTLF